MQLKVEPNLLFCLTLGDYSSIHTVNKTQLSQVIIQVAASIKDIILPGQYQTANRQSQCGLIHFSQIVFLCELLKITHVVRNTSASVKFICTGCVNSQFIADVLTTNNLTRLYNVLWLCVFGVFIPCSDQKWTSQCIFRMAEVSR